jgi:DinB superfamily
MSEQPAASSASSPDPIDEPKAYQDFLLAALGDDDPATVQAGTPAAMRQLVSEAGLHLRTRPAPGEWSALEALGHVVDAEVVSSARYRFIVAHDEPPLIGYDQDLWVRGLHHNDDDPSALLDQFEAMRLANVAMWRRSSPADRGRVGMHEERGAESYELTFRLISGHDRVHLAQARHALRDAQRR